MIDATALGICWFMTLYAASVRYHLGWSEFILVIVSTLISIIYLAIVKEPHGERTVRSSFRAVRRGGPSRYQ